MVVVIAERRRGCCGSLLWESLTPPTTRDAMASWAPKRRGWGSRREASGRGSIREALGAATRWTYLRTWGNSGEAGGLRVEMEGWGMRLRGGHDLCHALWPRGDCLFSIATGKPLQGVSKGGTCLWKEWRVIRVTDMITTIQGDWSFWWFYTTVLILEAYLFPGRIHTHTHTHTHTHLHALYNYLLFWPINYK